MEHRNIGSLRVSVIGLGCNNFGRRLDQAATTDVVRAAMDAGINFFDTANIYGIGESETQLGKALGSDRADVLIASKFGMDMGGGEKGARPEYIHQAVDASLRRLGTDYIDLYQLHTPDEDVPIADTLGAMRELVRMGKVREIGCSNFSVAQLEEAAAVPGGPAFVSVQNHHSLLHREPEEGLLEWCRANSTGFIPFFPLQNGLLTGKYRLDRDRPQGTRLSEGERGDRLLTEANLRLVEDLIAFASRQDRSLLELAFGWLLTFDAVSSVIAGATSAAQVQGNAASGGWRLNEAERDEVLGILSDHSA